MNVLFVTNTKFATEPHRDSSTRYRCFHVAESLQACGHLADVTTLDTLSLSNLSRYDVVSVLRPFATRKLLALLQRCKKQSIRTIADFDELIFDPELSSDPKLRARFTRHNLAAQSFDEVTVSTEELATSMRAKYPEKPVTVIYNGLSEFWLSLNSVIKDGSASDVADRTKTITYMPGTRGHNADFEEAQNGIAEFLNNRSEASLNIVGPLNINESVIPSNKVTRGVWIDYMDLPFVIRDSWVTIAPLQSTQRNQGKSHVKFIESAAFGTPIICSPTPDMARHKVDGLIMAISSSEWTAALEKLSDEDYYQHCQQSLRNYVREHCMADSTVRELIAHLSKQIEQVQNEPFADISKAG